MRRLVIIAIPIFATRAYGPFGLIQRHGAYEGHSVGASASMRCVRKLMQSVLAIRCDMHVNQTKIERFFSVYQSKMCRFVILSFRSRSTRNWARTLASVLKADASAWAAQSGRPFFWSIRIVRTGTTATSRSNLSASKAKGRLANKVIAVAIK